MSAMTDKFQRGRWSKTRQHMDAMKPGQTTTLPAREYANAHSSTSRLNDAYRGRRKYTTEKHGDRVHVARTK